MENRIFRPVVSVPGLEVTRDAEFRYRGRKKKATYYFTVAGRKATVRISIMINGKTHYWQAAKLVAEAWKFNFSSECYLTYRDGDIHNIKSDNLVVSDKQGFYKYMLRNSGLKAKSIDERKAKLELIANEAMMTKRYLETMDMKEINSHVTEYLYPCLMEYALKTLHMGEADSLEQVPEVLARMYECIMNGMCLYNYERYCKKLLHNYKKNGSFGVTGIAPKPIQIRVEQLNLDSLWRKYKVKKIKN
nr:MAG TPA: hypothetical protein [Caudoviricetes sp.]